jgi:hypothetical protein
VQAEILISELHLLHATHPEGHPRLVSMIRSLMLAFDNNHAMYKATHRLRQKFVRGLLSSRDDLPESSLTMKKKLKALNIWYAKDPRFLFQDLISTLVFEVDILFCLKDIEDDLYAEHKKLYDLCSELAIDNIEVPYGLQCELLRISKAAKWVSRLLQQTETDDITVDELLSSTYKASLSYFGLYVLYDYFTLNPFKVKKYMNEAEYLSYCQQFLTEIGGIVVYDYVSLALEDYFNEYVLLLNCEAMDLLLLEP